MQSKKMTIHDIAKESGVSVATVSRMLNGSGTVSNKTRLKIQQVIDRYDYQPNMIAKQLSNQKTEQLGLVVPDITNPFYAEMSQAVEQAAMKRGYAVMICNTMSTYSLEQRYLNDLVNRRVDGIIMLGGSANNTLLTTEEAQAIRQKFTDTPVVFIDGHIPGLASVSLLSNVEQGLHELLDYLISLGHSRITFMGGWEGVSVFDDKARIYTDYMKKRDLEEFTRVVPGGFSFKNGYTAMKDHIERGISDDAIICISDLFAAGVIRACQENGISVPGQLSVSGFDNTEYCEMISPNLTSLGHNYQQLGESAVNEVLRGFVEQAEQLFFDMELTVRRSTGPEQID